MAKRMTIRLVDELANAVTDTAKERGISVNALVSEMAWGFVSHWKKLRQESSDEESSQTADR